jgi:hypothetical protein
LAKVLTPEQEGTLVLAYLGGSSLGGLAILNGCSVGAVRNTLLRRGTPLQPSGPRTKLLPETRICTTCQNPFPRSSFKKKSSECPGCLSEKQKDRYQNDPAFRQAHLEDERRRRSGWTTGTSRPCGRYRLGSVQYATLKWPRRAAAALQYMPTTTISRARFEPCCAQIATGVSATSRIPLSSLVGSGLFGGS